MKRCLYLINEGEKLFCFFLFPILSYLLDQDWVTTKKPYAVSSDIKFMEGMKLPISLDAFSIEFQLTKF